MKKNLSEEEIDKMAVVKADDDSAWEKPFRMQKNRPTSLSIPIEIALGKLSWLNRIGKREWLLTLFKSGLN